MTDDAPAWGVAYHEAAHAVVAWVLGYEILSIKITPSEASGETRLKAGRPQPIHNLMIALAGKAGQIRFDPKSHQFRDGERAPQAMDDARHMFEALQEIAPGDEEEQEKVRASCYREVAALLAQPAVWALIDHVAAALYEKGEIGASRFADMVPSQILR
jgi:Peptidase M50B-like